MGVGLLKVAALGWSLLNIEKLRVGYVHLGLGCVLVGAGK
jgi:hypothetical protein